MMDELRWIQMFSSLMLMIQIAVSETEISIFMKVGDDVTLPCLNVIDEQNNCDGTEWTFVSRHKTTVELITIGQIGEEAKVKSDRLSVTVNCSLVIKNLTFEEVGLYSCLQYKLGEIQTLNALVHLSQVNLFIINLTEHKNTDKVTLSCSVVTYGECHHTVKWMIKGRDVDKENKQIVTSQTHCAATVSFLESHYFYPSRFNIMKCEVTDTNTRRVQLFTFSPQPSGEETGDTKTTKNPARKTEISTKSETTPTIKSPSESAIQWFIIPAAGLVSLLVIVVLFIRWKRTRGNKTLTDEDAGLSLNPAETRSAPQTSQLLADPAVSYATVSYTKNTNSNTRIRGDDDNDVTYCTMKAPLSSAAATADPDNLYSAVSFPIT